jgi:imidazolonepropionase-like amidohydrolase
MDTLFTGGRVIDCTGAPALDDISVLVQNGKIAAIGPRGELRTDANAQVVDLDGATLLPGLWDVHVHLGSLVPPWERGGREESETSYAFRCVRKAQDNLFAGVTSIRTAGDRFDADLQLKAAIDSGTLLGPRIFASGDSSWSRGAAGADEYRRRARMLLWRGADHIKLFASGAIAAPVARSIGHTICTPDELRAAVEEAHRWDKPAQIHAIGDDAVIAAAEAGADSVEHGFILGERGIQAMVQHNTIFSPQLAVTAAWNEEYMRGANCYPEWLITNAVEARAGHHQAFRQAIAAGLTIVAGVDNLPRPSFTSGIEMFEGRPALVAEVRLMAENGLPPMQALMATTSNAARVCRADDRLGTIQEGKLADLIVVDGNPLDNLNALADVRLVMKGGAIVRATGRLAHLV